MFKKTLYPKTKRVTESNVVLTEKLDGSNLGFFKDGDKLIVAQRNTIFNWYDVKDNPSYLYKGLYGWLSTYADKIMDSLVDKSGVFDEWIGMGKVKYTDTDIGEKFYIFSKARLVGENIKEYEVEKLQYGDFNYAFLDQIIPDYLGVVPVVYIDNYFSKEKLNEIYEKYCNEKK